MRYYKDIKNGYIITIGIGGGGERITETEYNNIMEIIRNKPQRTATTDYRLTTNLTWEVFEVEPVDTSEEPIDPQEAIDIIFGGGEE